MQWVAVLLGLAVLVPVPALPDADWAALLGGDVIVDLQDGVSELHREYDKVRRDINFRTHKQDGEPQLSQARTAERGDLSY
jgi:hypothetical protein